MAKTDDGKKFVPVDPYRKGDGTKVPGHIRSTPCTPKKGGCSPKPKK